MVARAFAASCTTQNVNLDENAGFQSEINTIHIGKALTAHVSFYRNITLQKYYIDTQDPSYSFIFYAIGGVHSTEMLMAARGMHAIMAMLKPMLFKSIGKVGQNTKIVIGTVKGDLHDIGKNLVAMMLEGAGFDIIDLGVNVPIEKFIEAIKEHKPHVLGMSALLTTTLDEMRINLQILDKIGMRKEVRIIVGGGDLLRKNSPMRLGQIDMHQMPLLLLISSNL